MNSITKTLVLTIVSALILNALAGCGSNRKSFEYLISDGHEIRTFEVFGMDCPGCHGGLENLINKIPGIKASKANWVKQQLQVVIKPDADVNDESIYDAIRQANFTPGKRLE